jgi:hypothetical protein
MLEQKGESGQAQLVLDSPHHNKVITTICRFEANGIHSLRQGMSSDLEHAKENQRAAATSFLVTCIAQIFLSFRNSPNLSR